MVLYQSGNGPSILLLHGFCEDHRVWNKLIPFLEVAFTCYRLDLPGFGQSECSENKSLETWAKAIANLFPEKQKLHVIGHSMGGYTALAFAELFPYSVSSLTLFHSTSSADSEEKKAARSKQIKFIKNHPLDKYIDPLIAGLFGPSADKELVRQQVIQGNEQSPKGISDALHAMKNRKDRTFILENATYPIHIISGKHDALLSLEQQAQLLISAKNGKWTVLQNSGHMGLLEEPDKVAEAILEFYKYQN